jgi:Protein of unknown function (DUF1566)
MSGPKRRTCWCARTWSAGSASTVSPRAFLSRVIPSGCAYRKENTGWRRSRPRGEPAWKQIVELKETQARTLTIPLATLVTRAEIQGRGYWMDPRTRLLWAAADNGSAVSWSQATYYCHHLTLGGHHDWTLPAIDDLQDIFGGTANDRGYRLVAPLSLTGWAWSSTPGKEAGEGWVLDFGDGARASVVAGDAGLNRAPCVRHAEL